LNRYFKIDLLLVHYILPVLVIGGVIPTIGCAPAATYAVGKVYLDKDNAEIYITENETDLAGCEIVKPVASQSYWGGLLQDDALKRVISDITHESIKAGANALLIREKSKSMGGGHLHQEMPIGVKIFIILTRVLFVKTQKTS
jgi:hypothetical protein